MRRLQIAILLMAISFSVSAGYYKNRVMEPWLGATQEELVARWGYPQAAYDIAKIDDETTVLTYRFVRHDGTAHCVIWFTVKKGIVTEYKYTGGNCPRYKR